MTGATITRLGIPAPQQCGARDLKWSRQYLARVAALLGLVAASLFTAAQTTAQEVYPTNPVHMVVPYPAGGTLDAVARLLQPRISKALGQPIIIDNRGGANGTVGTAQVARATADGYTILATAEPHIINRSLYPNLGYDPIADFAPVAMIATTPMVLAANLGVPANTVSELIRLAKDKPDTLTYGSIGAGSQHHIVGTIFAQRAGISLLHVPYRGGGPAMNDLVAGHIPLMFLASTSVMPLVAGDKIKVLATASADRLPYLPSVPTMAESGLPNLEAASWFAIFAPRKTPPEVIAKLYAAVVSAVEAPEVRERFRTLGLQSRASMDPDSFGAWLKTESEKFESVIRANNITLN